MKQGLQLVRYDAMVSAIVACESIDELKDYHDKALALELYAKQAKNLDAEVKAANIRLRAERRCGELFKEMQRAKTPNPDGRKGKPIMSNGVTQLKSPYASALESSGISRQTANRYQALADVPKEVFEEYVAGSTKASTNQIIREARNGPGATAIAEGKMPRDSLRLWGSVTYFDEEHFADSAPDKLLKPMTDTMVEDMQRIVPIMLKFYRELERILRHEHV
jgi:hypothetical protein